MNINKLEKLAIEWAAFDLENEYSPAIIELIAAYREAVSALKIGWSPYYVNGIDARKLADEAFADTESKP